jgi:hypothetical protein
MILRHKQNRDFTVVANKLLTDKRLSWEAKGILCYLLSKPDNWIVRMKDLKEQGKCSTYRVRKALLNLRTRGYIYVRTIRSTSGQLGGREIVVDDSPKC